MGKNFERKTTAPVEQREYGFNRCCIANGCFMAATNVVSWWGQDAGSRNGAPREGVCAYHGSKKPHQWQKITNNLHKAKPIITMWYRLNALPLYQIGRLSPAEINGFPKTKPNEGEDIFVWMNRLRDLIQMAAHYKLPEEKGVKVDRAGVTMDILIAEALSSMNTYNGGRNEY